jgi:hypothetical protein
MARAGARRGHRARLGLEALEPRLLLSADLGQQTALHSLVAPAPVDVSQAIAPASVSRPVNGMNLYDVSVGDSTGSLRLDMTWSNVPRGTSARVVVLDGSGNLLLDWSPAAAADSTTDTPSGGKWTPGTSLEVGIQIRATASPGGTARPSAFDLRVASEDGRTLLDLHGVANAGPSDSSPPPSAPSTPSGGSGLLVHYGSGGFGGSAWTATGPTTGTPGVGSVPGPSPSTTASTGAAAIQAAGSDGGGRATQALSTPTGILPLPASPYEPAGGIFRAQGTPASVARTEETRVDMSLVLMVSPGRETSPGDEWSSEPVPATSALPLVEAHPAPPRVVVVRSEPIDADGGPAPRPSGPIDPDIGIPYPEEPVRDVPWFATALATSSDGPAPPLPRGESTDRGGDREPEGSAGEAIVLGLSGSALLGVGLYAPDLAAALRRASPRPVRKSRSRPPSGRGQ